MSPHCRLVAASALLLLATGVGSGQRIEQSTPLVEKNPPIIQPPKDAAPSPAPVVPQEKPPAKSVKESPSVLSDFLTLFIFVALVAGIIIALVLAVALFFRLRAAEDPMIAALDDAWVQGRLRELEASPPEPTDGDEVPLEQAEAR
jgi:hypothetical protein